MGCSRAGCCGGEGARYVLQGGGKSVGKGEGMLREEREDAMV